MLFNKTNWSKSVQKKATGKENTTKPIAVKDTIAKKIASKVIENLSPKRNRSKPVLKWSTEDNSRLLEYVRENMFSFEVRVDFKFHALCNTHET